MHLTAKFHHPTFNRSEVILLTNKQTDSAENIHLAPLRGCGWWVNTEGVASQRYYTHLTRQSKLAVNQDTVQ